MTSPKNKKDPTPAIAFIKASMPAKKMVEVDVTIPNFAALSKFFASPRHTNNTTTIAVTFGESGYSSWPHCWYSGMTISMEGTKRKGMMALAVAHSLTPICDLASLPRSLTEAEAKESSYYYYHHYYLRKTYISARITFNADAHLDAILNNTPTITFFRSCAELPPPAP